MMSWLDTRKIIGITIYGKSLFSGFCCLPRFDAMFGLDFCLLARQFNNYVLKFYANCKQVSKDLRLTHFQIPRKGYDEANSFRDGSDAALKEGLWKKV